ncbi:MAG: class I SAM-dependent methyltransferase, partial [Acidimicrobiales bacterium]
AKALAAGLLLDAVTMRRRLAALPVVGGRGGQGGARSGDGPGPPAGSVERSYVLAVAAGVTVSPSVREAAAAHARDRGLDVLDLVPADLPVAAMVALARDVDPRSYRSNRLAIGAGAGQVTLVAAATARLVGDWPADIKDLDPVAYIRLMRRLKAAAPTTSDLAVAPGLRSGPCYPGQRLAALYARHPSSGAAGSAAPVLMGLRLAGLALGARCLGRGGRSAVAVAAAYCLRPVLAAAGTALRPRDRALAGGLGLAHGPWSWLRTVTGRWRPAEPDPREGLRGDYEQLLAGGLDGFFEAPRSACPWCGSAELRRALRTPDLFQHKPGRFSVDECSSCGHLFQNPRLSPAGLSFYYRDFYDGLGSEFMASTFASERGSYEGRIRMLAEVAEPERWLDVGAGHGHFCLMAREQWPGARFDGLDQGPSVLEARRRGWLDDAHLGQLPELAPGLAGTYDVVSMHHYLEHTTDPRAELDAAAAVLRPGGHLMIEVPDPEHALRRPLGSCWLPYLQPQHLQLLPVDNLRAALVERGFTVVAEQLSEAHQGADLSLALMLVLSRLVAPPDLPWRPRTRWPARAAHVGLFMLLAPALVPAAAMDRAIAGVLRPGQHGNAYRLVARRD